MQYDTETRQTLLNQARALINARRALIQDGQSVEAVIMAAIEAGADTRDAIIRTVPKFVGHSYATVARTLDNLTGPKPDRCLWFRDEAKKYHLHAVSAPIATVDV